MTDSEPEETLYETDRASLAQYAEMAKDFLPTIFALDAMGDVFFRQVKAAGMNCEQAATTLGKQVHQNLMRVALGTELPDAELVKLMNAMAVLLHLRRAQVQMVSDDADTMPPEALARIERLMENKENLTQMEIGARVRDIKKEFGL
jgi:hypothetical protein